VERCARKDRRAKARIADQGREGLVSRRANTSAAMPPTPTARR
jgi:hypothetical protein